MTAEDDTQPTTRRRRRERERAQEAAHAAGTVPEPSAEPVRQPPSPAAPVSEPAAVTGAQRAIGATLGRPRPRGRAAVALAVAAALAVVTVPLGLFLTGAGPSATSPAATAVPAVTLAGEAPLDEVMEVAGRAGAVPVVWLKGYLSPPSQVLTDVVVEGEGRQVAAGDGIVLLVSTFSGTDGTNTTGTESGTRLYRGLADPHALGEVLAQAVTGAREGSRLVLRAPVDSDQGTGTEITVVDVLPTTASGVPVETLPQDVPQATLQEDGSMAVDVGGRPVPTHGSTTVLVQGQGEQVRSTDRLVARYTVVSWTDGAVVSSSYGWTTPPGVIDMTDTLSGLANRLVDVQVGSRVVVSLPADQARGDTAIVVVVDVLAISDGASLTEAGATASPAPSDGVVYVTPSAAPSS
ncbi:FKBP-type peptidyl-prolyl cis-trans isomerase [Actinomyces faecalis]|uniref:FKBP-type peptidyl-prolyl cis-trans isomerase n=1 Tax=Actinomyces faecalis TaxID=2722820 RepID=UPI001553C0D2|nr:hypothetical protein [Actinomyces faecalis]